MGLGLGNFAETSYIALAKAIPSLFREVNNAPIVELGASAPPNIPETDMAITIEDHNLNIGDMISIASIKRNNLVQGKTFDGNTGVLTFDLALPHDRSTYRDAVNTGVVFPEFEKFTITGLGENGAGKEYFQGYGEQTGVYLTTTPGQEDITLPSDPIYLEESIFLGQSEFEIKDVIDEDTIVIEFPEAVTWVESDSVLVSVDVFLYGNMNVVVDDKQIQRDIIDLNLQGGPYVWIAGGDMENSLDEGEALINTVQVNQGFDIVLGQVHNNPEEAVLFSYKATGEYTEQIVKYMHGNDNYRFVHAGFLESSTSMTLYGLHFTRNVQIDLSTDLDKQNSRKLSIIRQAQRRLRV